MRSWQPPGSPAVAATGIPSDLLRRRADVRRAERELAQAAALSAQATAELFPRLSLSAALVFALVAVRHGVGEQLGRELASYGANLLVLPDSTPLRFGLGALELGPVEEERSLSDAALRALPQAGVRVESVAPGLLAGWTQLQGKELS